MNNHRGYAASVLRSSSFLTALGCLLTGLFIAGWRSAEAAYGEIAGLAAPQQNPLPETARPVPPTDGAAFGAGSQLTDTTAALPGGYVIQRQDGKTSCRVASAEELRALTQHSADTELHVLRDEKNSLTTADAPQTGLKIILRGTAQLEQHPEAKEAFLRAAHFWESVIQNRITVIIDVDYGPTHFGKPFGLDFIGVTEHQRFATSTLYPTVRSALIRSAGSPQEAALYSALPADSLPTDLGPTTATFAHVPTLRALRLLPSVPDLEAEKDLLGAPPSIGFNSANPFDFDPTDGIKPKRTDFTALAMHEIGHALGFFSGVGINELNPNLPPSPEVLDLFRFRPGVTAAAFPGAPRVLTPGGEHRFFDGGAELAFATSRSDLVGGDGDQAGHWKDDDFTGNFLGIMDPSTSEGIRYEMTENDLRAFEAIGYRTNPLPGAHRAELKLDDGTVDSGLISDGLMLVTRLTPPAYPASLRKLRIMFPRLQNQPDPAGRPVTLLIYAQEGASGQLPSNAPFRRIETIVPSGDNELFAEFTIPDGPTINSGHFFVGYQAPSPRQGVGFAEDFSGVAENRTFISVNNGASFVPLAEALKVPTANAMIRAVVEDVGGPAPTPTPKPTPVPGIPADVPLTSGVPQPDRMISWATNGVPFARQYTIQVPAGARQLKVDLRGDTELDLYVRFGARNSFQNGDIVADFIADGEGNEESITITPASAPALQAGLYYFAIVNYGPGLSNFTITATVAQSDNPPVASVSAASFTGEALASESLVAAFGNGLATKLELAQGMPLPTTLAGTRVSVRDSAGTERLAPLLFVAPTQINYLVPAGSAPGAASVTVTSGDGQVSTGTLTIAPVAPGFFTANADGKGVAAAVVLRIKADGTQQYEPVANYDAAQKRFIPAPIDLGPDLSNASDQVFLILFGTGLRNRSALAAVTASLGGVNAEVLYAGPQGVFAGMDQVNLRLPRNLAGQGEIDLALMADGRVANPVKVQFR